MTYDEIINLLVPALGGLGRLPLVGEAKKLDEETGVDYYRKYSLSQDSHRGPLPEDYANFLRQLAGPHAKTILKAYRIKKGLE